jgi:HAD superfamily hydrolase (TIGR01509 family)
MTSPFQAVILDMDGTLVDSNHAHTRAWVEALAQHGYEVPFDKVRPLIGMGGDKLLPAVSGLDKQSPVGQHITTMREEIFTLQYLPRILAFPEVRPLLLRMREQGLRLVIASSAQQQELDLLLQRAGVKELIEDRVSSSDIANSKPSPDAIHAALDKLQLPPEEVVMLGDTPYDIQAAAAARVATIALRCGGWNDTDLRGAIAIYDDPADLLANYHQSPLV